jgi:hypothetical protein
MSVEQEPMQISNPAIGTGGQSSATADPHLLLVYKYLKCKHGISSIGNNELKVSKMDDTNDPYEMLPCFVDGKGQCATAQDARKFFRQLIAGKAGFTCFSAKINDPVIWSHYADSHKGMAFEFGFPTSDGHLIEVEYSDSRVTVQVGEGSGPAESDSFDIYKRLVRTKFTSWEYEKEYRLLEPRSELREENGKFFKKFIPKAYFRRVILGCDCPAQESMVRSLLTKTRFDRVTVVRACLNDRGFEMVIPNA